MNWDRLDEFYHFARAVAEELTLEELCNQFIHSFLFVREGVFETDDEAAEPGGLAGFFVASDRARSVRLYRIDVHSLIDLLRLVGTEEVVASEMVRDASGQWQVSNMTAADMDIAKPGWRDNHSLMARSMRSTDDRTAESLVVDGNVVDMRDAPNE